MKVTGEAVLHAPVERVWEALNDPAMLVRTIPGCERLEATGPDTYRMTVTAGVASIKGSYAGEVRLTDQELPSRFRMKASGAGGPGTVSTDVVVSLEDDGTGGTRLRYDADAVVGGVIAGVGQRMLTAVAKKIAGEFFRAVDDELTGKAPMAQPPTVAGAESEGVFVAPVAGAAGRRGGGSFLQGAVVGAAAALAGVVVGALIGRRR